MILSTFPQLLHITWAPAILRIALAAVLIYLLIHHFKHRGAVAQELLWVGRGVALAAVWVLIAIELLAAILLFVGAWTQVAAILVGIGFVKALIMKNKFPTLYPLSFVSYLLLATIALSLIFSSAGAFAFDVYL
jgi:uncharacterized membrane protein YphA (DoxX/SURF4 family)